MQQGKETSTEDDGSSTVMLDLVTKQFSEKQIYSISMCSLSLIITNIRWKTKHFSYQHCESCLEENNMYLPNIISRANKAQCNLQRQMSMRFSINPSETRTDLIFHFRKTQIWWWFKYFNTLPFTFSPNLMHLLLQWLRSSK